MTTTLPNVVPPLLAWDVSGPHEWNYRWFSLYHDKSIITTDLPDINELRLHQTVGLLLTRDGKLHIYHDGRHTKKVATDLPVNHHLWEALDVYGKCAKIKSELLSGELDGVCMYLVCTQCYTSTGACRCCVYSYKENALKCKRSVQFPHVHCEIDMIDGWDHSFSSVCL